jgi:translation elongation factor EF-4
MKLSASRWSQRWVVTRLPPQGHADAPRKALLVDSWYDPYLSVVTLFQR